MTNIYTLTCSKCGEQRKTNYVTYKKMENENKLDSYVCRKCKKKGD